MSLSKTLALVVSLSMLVPAAPAAQDTGPYHLERSNESAWLGGGFALALAGSLVLRELEPYSVEEISALDVADINRFDRALMQPYSEDHLGDALAVASFTFPFLLLARDDVRDNGGDLALMWFEAAVLNQGVASLTKGLVRRARPYTYDPACRMEAKTGRSARLSFFSAHSSFSAMNCFFTATVFSDYSSDRDAETMVWGGAVLCSVLTAFSRVESGHHFATDVISGLVIGAAIGSLVPALHRNDDANAGTAPATSSQSMKVGVAFGL
jgi:membrane-associated phospholipid phosphatase